MSATVRAGKLIGVGVGPGDPELMTVKATRALHEADVHGRRRELVRETEPTQGFVGLHLARDRVEECSRLGA